MIATAPTPGPIQQKLPQSLRIDVPLPDQVQVPADARRLTLDLSAYQGQQAPHRVTASVARPLTDPDELASLKDLTADSVLTGVPATQLWRRTTERIGGADSQVAHRVAALVDTLRGAELLSGAPARGPQPGKITLLLGHAGDASPKYERFAFDPAALTPAQQHAVAAITQFADDLPGLR